MTTTIERRFFSPAEVRVKRAEGQPPMLTGYAAVFNVRTDIGSFSEEVARGAFSESLKVDDVRALFNHDPNYVLGRTAAATARYWEDDKGLAFEITPPDTQAGRDTVALVERGDVTGASFGFQTIDDSWRRIEGEKDHRTLLKVKLWDAGPVTYPQYTETVVDARSHEAWKKSQEPPPLEGPSDDMKKRARRQMLAELDL